MKSPPATFRDAFAVDDTLTAAALNDVTIEFTIDADDETVSVCLLPAEARRLRDWLIAALASEETAR